MGYLDKIQHPGKNGRKYEPRPFHLFIICIASVYAQNTYYPDYMPLSVGNKWQYYQHSSRSDYPSTYNISTTTVKSSFITDGTTWYVVGYDTVSYSRQSGELYVNGRRRMDFSQPAGYSFGDTVIKEGSESIFDSTYFCLGYEYDTDYLISWSTTNGYYAASLGLVSTYSYQGMHGAMYNSSSSDLIMAVIHDSLGNSHYYSNHYKPQLKQTGISLNGNQNLTYELSVKHKYQQLNTNYQNYSVTGNNFIDSAAFQSYYSLGDSIIQCLPVVIKKTEPDTDYTFHAVLDTNLLKGGFTFNYRVMAVDLGLIPETSYLPDTGWYKYNWGDVLSSKEPGMNKKDFALYQNYPNPFNPATTIRISVPQRETVSVKVYDALGREIQTLIDEELVAGEYRVVFNAANLSSGVYYYRMKAGNYLRTNKMLFIK
jgi:hypothetical protein